MFPEACCPRNANETIKGVVSRVTMMYKATSCQEAAHRHTESPCQHRGDSYLGPKKHAALAQQALSLTLSRHTHCIIHMARGGRGGGRGGRGAAAQLPSGWGIMEEPDPRPMELFPVSLRILSLDLLYSRPLD